MQKILIFWWAERRVIGPSRKYFWGNQTEEKKKGRPKLGWLNRIKNDMKSIGVKRWRKKVEDRSVWAVVLKEALPGPYANSQKDQKETKEGSLSDPHVV